MAVFKQVVEDIETDFKPNEKAKFWQKNLRHRIEDFLESGNGGSSDEAKDKDVLDERARERETGW